MQDFVYVALAIPVEDYSVCPSSMGFFHSLDYFQAPSASEIQNSKKLCNFTPGIWRANWVSYLHTQIIAVKHYFN